jgi:hypothetical protein
MDSRLTHLRLLPLSSFYEFVYQLFLGCPGNVYMKSPVLTFSSDKHAPTLWASVQISTAALASINNQAALIRYRETDQPILTIPGPAAQAGTLGSVSFAGHGLLWLRLWR